MKKLDLTNILTNLTTFDNLDNFGQFWQFPTIFTVFENVGQCWTTFYNFGQFWQFGYFWEFGQFGKMLTIFKIWTILSIFKFWKSLTIFYTFENFGQFWTKTILVIWIISDTDFNSDNWEPDFMTICVTCQLRVTLDSICNLAMFCSTKPRWCTNVELVSWNVFLEWLSLNLRGAELILKASNIYASRCSRTYFFIKEK